MTCIVGLIDKGNVYLGGDRAGVDIDTYALRVQKHPKIFKRGDMLLGYTTSFRMGNLLQYVLEIPLHPAEISEIEYLSTSFVNAVKDCFIKNGFGTKNKEKDMGGIFLVGYHGKLFKVEEEYEVTESIHTFAAVGSGDEYALGSLHSTNDLFPPELRLEMALRAAAELNITVSPPFDIISSNGRGVTHD